MKILSLDDNADNRYLLETILRSAGYHVESAANGLEGLEKLEGTRFDLIVSDILMPQMDGFQFCREVKKRPDLRETPFIFYTATYTERKDEELGLSLGAARFVIKPVEPEEFLTIVRVVVDEWKTGKVHTPSRSAQEEHVYLKAYNARLITKLERKVAQLESVTRDLQVAIEAKERELAERRRIEDAIRESEARLRLAQQVGCIGSWDVDLQTNTLHWSDETFRLYGLAPNQLVPTQETVLHLVHPADRERVQTALQEHIRTGAPYRIDHRIVHPDGSERVLTAQAILFANESGQPVRIVGTVQDVTDRRRLEEQLRQSQKMEAIGQLAAGVAHDFNNLLTVIQGNASLQLETPGVSEECANRAKQVIDAAERAAGLTRQLLLFSRRQVMEPAFLDLSVTVANMTKMLQRVLGEDIALQSEFAPALPCIFGDAGMIEQVILNLAVNSRDAMQGGGRLVISTASVAIRQDQSQQNPDATPGRCVCLSVRDTGCGIAPDLLPHIFEPFFTTKEIGKGTGLGLATVYGIVKQHHGWIELETKVNEGTTFHIFLPAVEGVPAERKTIPDEVPLPQGQETILVVEDEAALRLLVNNLLQRCGYTVLLAESGVAAFRVWKREKDRIQLLLTDMIMPDGVTGRELAERLRGEKPNLKVIYTSGYSSEVVCKGLPLVEGVSFLQKPYPPLRLAQTVRNCLDKSS